MSCNTLSLKKLYLWQASIWFSLAPAALALPQSPHTQLLVSPYALVIAFCNYEQTVIV